MAGWAGGAAQRHRAPSLAGIVRAVGARRVGASVAAAGRHACCRVLHRPASAQRSRAWLPAACAGWRGYTVWHLLQRESGRELTNGCARSRVFARHPGWLLRFRRCAAGQVAGLVAVSGTH